MAREDWIAILGVLFRRKKRNRDHDASIGSRKWIRLDGGLGVRGECSRLVCVSRLGKVK